MAQYDFPPHRKGDTFNGIQFSMLISSVVLDLTDTEIKMDLRNKSNEKIKSFSNGFEGGISIKSPATEGIFYFNRQLIDIPADTYKFDIQFTFPTGEIKTYIWGNWIIVQDVTHD